MKDKWHIAKSKHAELISSMTLNDNKMSTHGKDFIIKYIKK